MDSTYHRFEALFDQLGLPSDTCSIKFFIAENSPLNEHIRLEEAPCWTPSQATFLHEKIQLDADWAVVVDQLNIAMRGSQLEAPSDHGVPLQDTHAAAQSSLQCEDLKTANSPR